MTLTTAQDKAKTLFNQIKIEKQIVSRILFVRRSIRMIIYLFRQAGNPVHCIMTGMIPCDGMRSTRRSSCESGRRPAPCGTSSYL